MEAVKAIGKDADEGTVALTEAESKILLKKYGVPVVEEAVISTVEQAVSKSAVFGFPVVLKGLGTKLTHKTERGLVKLNLASAIEVKNACLEIQNSAGADLEGFLLQPQIQGKREFVAGLFQDEQFGPVVMFGLGGVFTEALQDVVFRIAPFDEIQAEDMMEEIMSSKLLEGFRGESPADKKQLINVLLGLSKLGTERLDIKEVDINPLLVSPDGKVTAVDALVVLNMDNRSAAKRRFAERTPQEIEVLNAALEQMVNAKSIAVIGAMRPRNRGFRGMFGCLKDFGFPGKLYPINPKADEIDGIKTHPSLASLKKPVDLVIIAVPAPFVPDALRDCVASGSKNVHIFSSGFKETGEEEGLRLQAEIEKIAAEGKLNVIGPNCMGLYVPKSRIVTWVAPPDKSGPVAFITQSGGHSQDFSNYASSHFGIYFSKVISYGNALTMDSTDFLEFFSHDEETKIITIYLEGVKNGRKLLELITRINKEKPVIILKAGLTESGARAVSSHTGSMAGTEKIWSAFFKQSGAIRVNSLEQMAEVSAAFLNVGKVEGRRVAVVGTGGGIGVAAADSCAQLGLDLVSLPAEVTQKLRQFIPPAGNMIRNPIDAHLLFIELELFGKTLEILSESYVDMFIISLQLEWLYNFDNGAQLENVINYIAQKAHNHTGGKPLVVVPRQYSPLPKYVKKRFMMQRILCEAGVPVYSVLPQAVFALAKLAEYYDFQSKHGGHTEQHAAKKMMPSN
ncbi:MAG TPA: acetate--CoA ligase family protein [Smithellaceae bacterium]|nr:acetate--CoA ligase family protein [Smithellaceae bacterium]